jgi:DNA primase
VSPFNQNVLAWINLHVQTYDDLCWSAATEKIIEKQAHCVKIYMSRFTKESVQRLREAVDIVDLISRYVPLKKAGGLYKACCPFHDEKTPSFTVHKATSHYHCFGCGAHGDAVAFLMNYERLGFIQALEFLSERFNVQLDTEHEDKEFEVSRGRLKRILEASNQFFHTMLLFSDVASCARGYLAKRGLSLRLLEAFRIGYAPDGALRNFLHGEGFTDKEMELAGLLSVREGKKREFFSDRITFPILDVMGSTIGFSARKYKEETFGGKYINSPETILFKKSRVLFGIFHSKKRMAKERIACVVEGQLDALRLIEAGFDFTVATLGTAFGPAHVDQLRGIGVEEVYLAFDQDEPGKISTEKSGDLLMKKGIDVRVVRYEEAKDPDELLSCFGKTAFFEALTKSTGYLEFLVDRAKKQRDFSSPVEKDRAVKAIVEGIMGWENELLRYEALKKLSRLADIPESVLNIGQAPSITSSERKVEIVPLKQSNENLSLEIDLLRWLTCSDKDRSAIMQLCDTYIVPEDFSSDVTRKLYSLCMEQLRVGQEVDFLHLAPEFDPEAIGEILKELLLKKPVPGKLLPFATAAITKIKERNWLNERETIRKKMEQPGVGEEELMALAEQFDLKKAPKIVLENT